MGARFSAPFQPDRGAQPAPCTMGTGSFLGVKRPGLGADSPHPPSVLRAIPLPSLRALVVCYRENLYLTKYLPLTGIPSVDRPAY